MYRITHQQVTLTSLIRQRSHLSSGKKVLPKKVVDKKLLYEAGGLLFVSCSTVSVICQM